MKKLKMFTFIFIIFFCFSIMVNAEEIPTNSLNDINSNLEEIVNTENDNGKENVEENNGDKKLDNSVENDLPKTMLLKSTPTLTNTNEQNNNSEPENSSNQVDQNQPDQNPQVQVDPEEPKEPEIVRIKPTINYQTHVQNIGWQSYVGSGELSGTTGRSLRLEGIKINLTGSNISGGITYQTHIQNIGWSSWSKTNEMSGTTGQSLRLEAIRINLTGDLANYYDIYYQVHAENYGWLGWAKNGEEAGTAGFSLRLEAIKIVIVEKDATAPGNITNHYYAKPTEIVYSTHVQNIGWTTESKNGEMSGTTGQSLRLEGIKINVGSVKYSGSVLYQTHIQNIGWSNWSKNGEMSGTTGQSLRLEAIKIKLEGELSNYYDVYYHTHVQDIGWTGWVKNGEPSGTTGQSRRLEGIEIKLIEKGGVAPNVESNFVWYYEGNTKVLTNAASNLKITNAKKIIDVSENNGRIDWNKVKNNADIDGVILRIGFGSYSIDGEFLYNLGEVKRLGIPYGVYLFSYAENNAEALSEANFVKNTLKNNNANPTLGVYYDLENWRIDSNSNTDNISASTYENMINTFINNLQGYNASVYTYISFANNKLTNNARTKITWIAQYHSKCEYMGNYNMWQYSSSGSIPGIKTRVDMNVRF